MASIMLRGFAGEAPRVAPRELAEQSAQVARNVDLSRGRLEAARTPLATALAVAAGSKSIFRYNKEANGGQGYWFSASDAVRFIPSPAAKDVWGRVYFAGGDMPRMTAIDVAQGPAGPYPLGSYALGIPAPGSAPTATGPGGTPPTGALKIAATYVVTFVSKYGEEGPPSSATALVDRWDGGAVSLTLLPVHSGANNITQKRIYRSEGGGSFLLVAQVANATTSYTDNVKTEDLGQLMESLEWDGPDPAMRGLVALPNGALAGHFDNVLCFSEMYLPHAWPVSYRISLAHKIVGLVVVSGGLVVVTEGRPYLVSGGTPESMQPVALDVPEACVSARGVVDMGEFALYPSANGLVAIGGPDAQVVTWDIITPEQWRALRPSSIHAYRVGNAYLGFYDTGMVKGGFEFSPEQGLRWFDFHAEGGMLDMEEGRLYLAGATGAISVWGEGAQAAYTWRSKQFGVPSGRVFSALQVDAGAYPVTVRLYSDGVQFLERTVSGKAAVRIPAKRGRVFEVEIAGTAPVDLVIVSTSMNEVM